MQKFWKMLLTNPRIKCALRTRGRHDFKRARRTLGNAGQQTCRVCGVERAVALRPRRQPTLLHEPPPNRIPSGGW